MMRNVLILLTLVFFSNPKLFGQNDAFEKATKEKTFSIGNTWITHNTMVRDSLTSTGVIMEFDYAWKLSGYNHKPAAYISVPIGYGSYMMGNGHHFSLLYYGWTVRHELTRDKKLTPYLGYSLLLNQLRQVDVDGSVMGHQTKFELGGNLQLSGKKRLHLSLLYSMYRFPKLGDSVTDQIRSVSVMAGFRF